MLVSEVLPQTAWQALLEYLQASGRLRSLQPEEYLFAPLVDPVHGATDQPGDWNSRRPLTENHTLVLLHQYAAWAGLPARKVTFRALRNTAATLRLESGEEVEAVRTRPLPPPPACSDIPPPNPTHADPFYPSPASSAT